MGAGYLTTVVKEEKVEYPLVPPGFKPLTSFTLKKIADNEIVASEVACGSQAMLTDSENDIDVAYLKDSLKRRPWINYSEFDGGLEESEPKQLTENLTERSLPKGVLRGCSECSNCQKVVAKWRPNDACRPLLGDAPVFHPSEEEFKDALKYIATIRPSAEKYGICRIVPPPSWNPPCPLKEKGIWGNSNFATRIQQIDKLQNRDSVRKMYGIHGNSKRKKRKYQEAGVQRNIAEGDVRTSNEVECSDEAKPFGFEPGPMFTLDAFQKYANDFKSQYFGKDNDIVGEGDHGSLEKQWEPSLEDIEGEYWRMIEKPTEEIEVLYGADVDSGSFGSGFPKVSGPMLNAVYDEEYAKSDWNLNNLSRLPDSVLSFEKCDISGVIVPWLYIGMCFSSFCWHVEDHYLYSLNYMHWGAPKVWYGVPGEEAQKLEAAMKKHLPDLFKEQPDLLDKLVTQLSPSILTSENVPVYRCVQNPKEFVLTFPRAYHSGFNCGFNCAEAVNVAPLDWLPFGQHAVELYREQSRKTTISHDKLLFGAARETVRAHWELQLLRKNTPDNLRWKQVCGKDGVLAKALKSRVEMERTRRECFCSSYSVKMDDSFDATNERECSVCLYDLHLSAVGCPCSPEIFACLYHAKQLCACSLSERTFLFRYTINDLNILVEALEGKLSSIYRWAKLDLGLALSSFVSKDKSQSPQADGEISNSLQVLKQEGRSVDVVTPVCVSTKVCQGLKSPELHLKASISPKFSNQCTEFQRGNSVEKHSLSCSSSSVLKDVPPNKPVGDGASANKSLASGNDNVILLSDDEDECPVRHSDKATSVSSKFPKLSAWLANHDDKVSPCSFTNPKALSELQSKVLAMSEKKIIMKTEVRKDDHSSHPAHLKVDHGRGDRLMQSSMLQSDYKVQSSSQNTSCNVASSAAASIKDTSPKGDPVFCNLANAGILGQHPQPYGSGKSNNETKDQKIGVPSNLTRMAPSTTARMAPSTTGSSSRAVDTPARMPPSTTGSSSRAVDSPARMAPSTTGSSSRAVDTLDKDDSHKDPHSAKLVRRTNCSVEPLEFGVVLSGKLWSSSQAIYPKGFKSRVSYLSVLDPGKCCNYVSEILDAGLSGPLFMVKVETCPSEVFIHPSITKCWDMVKDRVNEEILKQRRLGRLNLPSFQQKGSVDGPEMFGFRSPAIIKGIEALDPNKICIEYWKSRSQTHPVGNSLNTGKNAVADQSVSSPDKVVLKGLFKKANTEELHSLHGVLSDDQKTVERGIVTQLLDEEIQGRSK